MSNAGLIETVVTFLEMRSRPTRPHAPAPRGKLAVLRAEQPTVPFYRFLYDTVGERWNWSERRLVPPDVLAATIGDPQVEIYVLYRGGVPAGFAELDMRKRTESGDVELAYFGLMPEFAGQGLGRFLLDWAVEAAWTREPKRLWIHTCTLDHPRAIVAYQRAGFIAYRQETQFVPPLPTR